MRCFIGIDLPPSLKSDITHIQEELDNTHNKIKFVNRENLHITLKFIGNVPEELTSNILNCTKEITEAIKPIPFKVDKIGAFPKIKHPTVIWIGSTEKNHKLNDLFHRIENALYHLKIEKEKRKFHPHITLGRTKQFKKKKELINMLKQINFPSHQIKIEAITLYKSKLSPKGPIYTTLGKCKLKR